MNTALIECQLKLDGCFEEAEYVAHLGAGGDCYACGPCMNKAEEADPEAGFVPFADITY